jgi:16S rRNA (guanine527-N7)-methyltransferase
MAANVDDKLIAELERSQRLGFLGPGPVATHVAHAEGFAAGLERPPERFLDMGSGGGVPGLVLALTWPDADAVLLDAGERRCAFLREAVGRLGLAGRVEVVRQRAEEAGRIPSRRAAFDLVVARSFGPPGVTAECSAPFLRVGGLLVVSEPPTGPEDAERWPAAGLALLGLAPGTVWRTTYGYRSLVQREPCPERYPRRVGRVAKRPLF